MQAHEFRTMDSAREGGADLSLTGDHLEDYLHDSAREGGADLSCIMFIRSSCP